MNGRISSLSSFEQKMTVNFSHIEVRRTTQPSGEVSKGD